MDQKQSIIGVFSHSFNPARDYSDVGLPSNQRLNARFSTKRNSDSQLSSRSTSQDPHVDEFQSERHASFELNLARHECAYSIELAVDQVDEVDICHLD